MAIIEQRVDKIKENKALKRKFHAAATEGLQNMVYHMRPVEDEDYVFFESNSGLIMVVIRGK